MGLGSGAGLARVPVAVLHMQACTGGTLLARCIAALPGTLLVNEVSPAGAVYNRFNPRDPVEQLLARHDVSFAEEPAARQALFDARLAPVIDHCRREGLSLVLREHSHSETMTKARGGDTLRAALGRMGVAHRGLVLLRYPLASFETARLSGFLGREPDLEAYCLRYLAFLERHEGCPRIRYEEFTERPEAALRQACGHLGLAFDARALARYPQIELAGNSGRHGADAAVHPVLMRRLGETLRRRAMSTPSFGALCVAMGYPPDPLDQAIRQARSVLAFDPADAQALAERDRLLEMARARGGPAGRGP